MKEQINLNGKEYLQLLKYKEQRSRNRWKAFDRGLKKHRNLIVTSLCLMCITILFIVVFQHLTYVEPVRTGYTWSGILKFLAIAVGFGWIFHGVGFSIVGKLS